MAKYEYKVEDKKVHEDFDRCTNDERDYIKQMSERNWELVSVLVNDMNLHWEKTTYYWKREISDKNMPW